MQLMYVYKFIVLRAFKACIIELKLAHCKKIFYTQLESFQYNKNKKKVRYGHLESVALLKFAK